MLTAATTTWLVSTTPPPHHYPLLQSPSFATTTLPYLSLLFHHLSLLPVLLHSYHLPLLPLPPFATNSFPPRAPDRSPSSRCRRPP